ncbi:major facilitator transporter (plasmid) [Rhodococcus opacus]|uniref:Major facilitator transporter n=1 Tax=Rhodococcus opacus TaxID=37919 RepID=A0A1B1KHR2_RHOOP|nr:MFS transporter [Rhodococcus opacus]ANS32134.1 major facilitator transporter [Rhodococcus opacus]
MSSLLQRMDRLPMCRPHYLLLLIGGLGYTFDGLDSAIVAFLLPSLKAEWGLSNTQLGVISAATPFGFLIGAVLSGILGDRIGRKRVMMYALAVYTAFTLVAACSLNIEMFTAARVLSGVGMGAESVIIAPYLSEFVPADRRGWFLGCLAGFFSFGFVTAALVGRFIVPEIPDGWRWAQVIVALPVVMLLWWRRALDESPRYLVGKKRYDEAEFVVAKFEAKVVKATGRGLTPVPTTDIAADIEVANHPKPGVARAWRYMWSPAMRRRTLVIWAVWFAITFSYYGFFSWIPSLLVQRGFDITRSFEFAIVIYLAQIPGYFSAAWLNEKMDRKNTIAIYLVGAAGSAFALSLGNNTASIVLSAAILSFFLNGTYAGVYSYTPEIFPTWMRTTGTGFASAFGRVGSISAPIVIGYFASSWGLAGVFTMTTIVLGIGVLSIVIFGVSTAGHSLEDLNEAELADENSAGPATAGTHKEAARPVTDVPADLP